LVITIFCYIISYIEEIDRKGDFMFQTVFSTLFQVIVPLSIPVIIGALLAHYKNLETKPLLTISLYYLSPALILDTLMKAQVSHHDVYITLAFSLLNLLVLWAIANNWKTIKTAFP
jgi:predicted permease